MIKEIRCKIPNQFLFFDQTKNISKEVKNTYNWLSRNAWKKGSRQVP